MIILLIANDDAVLGNCGSYCTFTDSCCISLEQFRSLHQKCCLVPRLHSPAFLSHSAIKKLGSGVWERGYSNSSFIPYSWCTLKKKNTQKKKWNYRVGVRSHGNEGLGMRLCQGLGMKSQSGTGNEVMSGTGNGVMSGTGNEIPSWGLPWSCYFPFLADSLQVMVN